MKNYILLITIGFLLLCNIVHSQVDKSKKLPFNKICYSVKWKGKTKLIDTYEEALKIGLTKKSTKAEQFYTENAVYLFQVGGGCFHPTRNEISIVLENNIILIDWQNTKPQKPCLVGKKGPFVGKVIINKTDYPNYKNLTVKYYWEE